MPPGDMTFGNDQAMTFRIGMNIQNAQGQVVFRDDVGRGFSLYDVTKQTRLVHSFRHDDYSRFSFG
jgi:poly(3-hydroxyalkanoate) synthetase